MHYLICSSQDAAVASPIFILQNGRTGMKLTQVHHWLKSRFIPIYQADSQLGLKNQVRKFSDEYLIYASQGSKEKI